MAERIRKTPIKQALAVMDTAWEDAAKRLDAMGPKEALSRMPGAVYSNSSHPFRDKLHIEGMRAAFQFVLTGHNEAVEYWLRRAKDIEAGEAQLPVSASTGPSEPWTKYVTRFVNRLFPIPRSS